MLRWAVVLIVLGAVAWFAASLAEIPGSVTLAWSDWRLDTSIGVFVAALLILAGTAALLYRLWWTLLRAPRAIGRMQRERRRRLGWDALSRGLVAVAAGDAETARRQARRAETLLDGKPLTMLLSAQAAQLDGDDQSAQRFFGDMRLRPETEFLGIRGLLAQALKHERWDDALELAERAHRLNPKSDWVASTLYDLQKRTGRLAQAEATLRQRAQLHALPPADAGRERADLLLEQSRSGPRDTALRLAKKAFRADPGYPPAAAHYARLLIEAGNHRRAAATLERAWSITPDASLAELYPKARESHDVLGDVKAMQRLATHNPDHPESRIAIAVAALEARLWGEARANLESIAGENAPPRVCRLMAELEESEHGDLARARVWLLRASGETVPAVPAATMPPPSPGPLAPTVVEPELPEVSPPPATAESIPGAEVAPTPAPAPATGDDTPRERVPEPAAVPRG